MRDAQDIVFVFPSSFSPSSLFLPYILLSLLFLAPGSPGPRAGSVRTDKEGEEDDVEEEEEEEEAEEDEKNHVEAGGRRGKRRRRRIGMRKRIGGG